MKSVYIFPGQGSQYRTMGSSLFDKYPEIVDQASEQLGYSIRELCLQDPDRVLNKTQYTQPALYTVCVMEYLNAIENLKETPDYVAGHSLGEYSALYAAGAFDFLTGLQIVERRGLLMSQAQKGIMAAILEINQDLVEKILFNSPFNNIDVANFNSRQQCIISGNYEELCDPRLEKLFTDAGARFVILNVSAAFHSRGMLDVQQRFSVFLSNFNLRPLSIPVIANNTAREYPSTNYQNLLIKQISTPVRWYESMSLLINKGYKNFVEIGPGDVLTKLNDKIQQDPMPFSQFGEYSATSSYERSELAIS